MAAPTVRGAIVRTAGAVLLLVVSVLLGLKPAAAGDPLLTVTGRVIECSSDLSQESLNSAIPPSCTTDIIEAPVTIFEAVAFPPESATQTGGDGNYRLVVGNDTSTNLILGTRLAVGEAGFASCIFQGRQGEYLGEAVIALDAKGQADIRAGQPAWWTATCNFLLYRPAAVESTFGGGIFLCDMDLTDLEVLIPIGEKCSQVGSGLLVLLTFPDGTQQSTTSDFEGGFDFFGLQAGANYTVTMNRNAFYDATMLVCSEVGPNNEMLKDDIRWFGGQSTSVSFAIQNRGATLSCSLLLYVLEAAPDPDGGDDSVSVDSAKYTCPAGAVHDSIDGYWESCELGPDGIQFTISGAASGMTASMSTGDVADGVVVFEDLPADEWTIQELKPAGFDRPVVYCALFAPDGNQLSDWTGVAVSDSDSITMTVEPGTALSCEWFNIPGTDGNTGPLPTATATQESESDPDEDRFLRLDVLTCPEGYDLFDEDAEPDQDCDEADLGIQFSAALRGDTFAQEETGSDGEVELDLTDADGDLFSIVQSFPDGVATAAIWSCERNRRTVESIFQPMYMVFEGGVVQMRIERGDTVECLWINVLEEADDEETGSHVPLSIEVRECQGVPNPLACTPGEGITVTLTDSNSDAELDLQSNSEGVASGSVPVGSYDISTSVSLCFVDAKDVGADGKLRVAGEELIELTIFVCT